MQITNICSTFVGMMPLFEKGSKEEQLLQDRVKACCAAQSRQIKISLAMQRCMEKF